MRKLFFVLVAFLSFSLGGSAEVVIDKLCTIKSVERGPLCYNPAQPNKLCAAYSAPFNPDDPNQQFVIVKPTGTSDNFYCIYSVGGNKFFSSSVEGNRLSLSENEPRTFEITQGALGGQNGWKIRQNSHRINVSSYHAPFIAFDGWNRDDGGNIFVIAEAGTGTVDPGLLENIKTKVNMKWKLGEAKTLMEKYNGKFGTGVYNQFRKPENWDTTLANINNLLAGTPTEQQATAAVNSARALVDGLALPVPAENAFFRMRSTKAGMGYLQGTASANQRFTLKKYNAGKGIDGTFVKVAGDKVLNVNTGQFVGNNNNHSGPKDYGQAGETVEFSTAQTKLGTYNIKIGSRYLAARDNATETDNGNSADNDLYTFWLEEVTEIPLTATAEIGGSHYGTFYTPVAGRVENGATAYKGKITGNQLILTEISGGQIPAGTAFVFKGNGRFKVAAVEGTITDNDLTGLMTNQAGNDNSYALSKHHKEFVKVPSDGFMRPFRAYLTSSSGSIQGFSLGFEDVTTITSVVEADDLDMPLFDLSGRRITTPVKGGMYIRNGKKLVQP